MELKSPTPLGEKKIGSNNLTTEFLEIAKNKEKDKKKFRLPLITLPSFNRKNLFKEKNPEIQQVEVEEKKESSTEKIAEAIRAETSKDDGKPISIKEFFSTIALPYVKTHKEKILNISLITVPLLLLIILFSAVMSYTKAEPYRVAKEFLNKIENKDARGAYELTTDAYQAVVPIKEFKKIVEKLNSVDISNAKIKQKSFEDKGVMGQYAYVKYKISGYYLNLVLFNDARDWGILSIEIVVIQ